MSLVDGDAQQFGIICRQPFPKWWEVEVYDAMSYDGNSCVTVTKTLNQSLPLALAFAEIVTSQFYEYVQAGGG